MQKGCNGKEKLLVIGDATVSWARINIPGRAGTPSGLLYL